MECYTELIVIILYLIKIITIYYCEVIKLKLKLKLKTKNIFYKNKSQMELIFISF